MEIKDMKKNIRRVSNFFNRDNMLKQLNAMISYLVSHRSDVTLKLNIGGGSFTDNKSITIGLPEIFLDRSLKEILIILIALIGHECQHIKSSNFVAFKAYQQNMIKYFNEKHKLPKSIIQKIAHGIANSVEDGRIEKILCSLYPGYLNKIKFLNSSFWKAQPVTGENELSEFIYTITILSVTGLYPKDYNKLYDNTELDKNISKIKPLIIKGINAKDCKTALSYCEEIMYTVEDYLVSLIEAEQGNQDMQDMLDQMASEPNFNSSEESDTTPSKTQSTHFRPEEENAKEEDDEENTESSSSKNSDEDEGEGEDSGSGEESEDETEEEKSSSSNGESSDENEDDTSDENEADGDGTDSSNEAGDKDSDDSTEENADSSDSSDSNGDDEDTDVSNSENIEGANQQGSIDEGKSDNDGEIDKSKEDTTHIYEDKKSDEDLIDESIQEIEDELIEEAEEKIKEIEKSERKENKNKKEDGEPLTAEDMQEIERKYKDDNYSKFEEIKGFPLHYSLPPELQREGKRCRKEVERILKNKESLNLRNQSKGVLNPNDLWKINMKDYNVFQQKGTASQSDYVAYLLQDGSGSMGEANKEVYSSNALSIMEEGFKGLIPFKISTFTVGRQKVIHYTVKDFNQNEKSKNYSYNFLRSRRASGGNKDGYSIRVATKEILSRPEKDKILIILSDGLPSDYRGGYIPGMNDVKEAIKEARKQGIFVVSMVFGTEVYRNDNIEKYRFMYEKNIISCDPSQMTNHLIKTLKKIIAR